MTHLWSAGRPAMRPFEKSPKKTTECIHISGEACDSHRSREKWPLPENFSTIKTRHILFFDESNAVHDMMYIQEDLLTSRTLDIRRDVGVQHDHACTSTISANLQRNVITTIPVEDVPRNYILKPS